MPRYLVEMYSPVSRAAEVEAAVARLADDGGVRHLRAAFVPEDETCFHFVDAPSVEAVRVALERAGIPYERITTVAERISPGGTAA